MKEWEEGLSIRSDGENNEDDLQVRIMKISIFTLRHTLWRIQVLVTCKLDCDSKLFHKIEVSLKL